MTTDKLKRLASLSENRSVHVSGGNCVEMHTVVTFAYTVRSIHVLDIFGSVHHHNGLEMK